jgi:hypothetical protein
MHDPQSFNADRWCRSPRGGTTYARKIKEFANIFFLVSIKRFQQLAGDIGNPIALVHQMISEKKLKRA